MNHEVDCVLRPPFGHSMQMDNINVLLCPLLLLCPLSSFQMTRKHGHGLILKRNLLGENENYLTLQ